MFIHTAVLEYVSSGANEIDSTNIAIEIKKLSRRNTQGISGFAEKFQVLRTSNALQKRTLAVMITRNLVIFFVVKGFQNLSLLKRLAKVSPFSTDDECDGALNPENQTKNRSRSIYPSKGYEF